MSRPTYDTARVEAARESFRSAHDEFLGSLEQFTEEAAHRTPADGGWTPAQIGAHVAITNELFAKVLTGEAPMAQPAAPGFAETFSFGDIPDKLTTFPMLEPPAGATRAEALDRLRSSADGLSRALRDVPPERWSCTVALPLGILSMYQFAEFAAGHVRRHLRQLQRAAE